MATTTKPTKISMKLLIDKTKRKVLFAEAGKECVDFILHILSLPLGTVVGFLTKESMSGSIGRIYGSFENLGANYLQEGLNKDCLLNPKPSSGSASNVPLLTVKPATSAPGDPGSKTLYTCSSNFHSYYSDGPGATCPIHSCRGQMSREMDYVIPPSSKKKEEGFGGYVKGVVTYMIMDDLCVQPMSTISSITLLNKFNVQDVGRLEEKEVVLDMNMGVALLKASLVSKTVLTDVFLGNKSAGVN